MSVEGINEPTQFLTFHLGNEVFAVEIARVREVLEYTKVTKVPRTPDFMLGVINLRGSVVPLVDMRAKFSMPQTKATVNTCFIIMEVLNEEGGQTVVGAMADSVREVFELQPDNVEKPPKIGTKLRADYLRGMGKHEGKFIMILDTDKIFSAHELRSIQQGQGADAD
ncbi:MAG: chemotaxis protein CheW [Magnetococcales bacterium]|nr:chemotaxis protein CheW [Magnetococcales bacterium]